MRLSLLAIMQDEAPLVARWAAGVRRIPDVFAEMVVIDGGSTDGTALGEYGVTVFHRDFPGDFADQRNYGIDRTSGDWIFEVDADEIPSLPLLSAMLGVIDDADRDGVDCVGIPRLNFHDGVLMTSPGHLGLDYQYRLHRRHCRWVGAVHEVIPQGECGYTRRIELDIIDGRFIAHMKTAARHAERNALYARMVSGVAE